MRPFASFVAAVVVLLLASNADAASYRIRLVAKSAPLEIANLSPVGQFAVALPQVALGNCPGGVCGVRQQASQPAVSVRNAVSIAVSCNRPVLRVTHAAADFIRDRQPVRSAVRRAISIVGRLFGR
jgi:hypothetical protein